MNSKQQFALVVRAIGLLGFIYCVRRLVQQGTCLGLDWALLIRLASVLIAVYLIRGAPLLVKFAYPERAGDSATTAS